MKKRILFLYSNTGGGHRSAYQAIRDALILKYGEEHFHFEAVDVFRECKWPLNRQPEWYVFMVNHARPLWRLLYFTGDGPRRAAFFSRWMYWGNQQRLVNMLKAHPADVIVSTHSVITPLVLRALRKMEQRPPFITVVTDLVSTPVYWYDNHVDRCLVPTEHAYQRGIHFGLTPEQLRVTGLPVNPHFIQALPEKVEARRQLGWDLTLPTVLMIAGSDGMGPVYKTAGAIDEQQIKCQLAIIAGNNKSLEDKLRQRSWNNITHVYGFVSNQEDMPRLMAAADILVTKAGPSTITEAGIAGLPMILSDAIPGQEDGNVQLVIENNAGVFAPDPQLAAQTVRKWLQDGKGELQQRAENARRIVYPDAVSEIAEEVWQWAQ